MEVNEIKTIEKKVRTGRNAGLVQRRKFIYTQCPSCKKYRWKQYSQTNRENYTGLCHRCWARKAASGINKLKGSKHSNWKGGRTKTKSGYILIWISSDDFFSPMVRRVGKSKGTYVLEHRLVMAKHLGRCLQSWEIIHHKNHIKDDNRIGNLQLVSDDRHKQITILEEKIKRLERENISMRQSVH